MKSNLIRKSYIDKNQLVYIINIDEEFVYLLTWIKTKERSECSNNCLKEQKRWKEKYDDFIKIKRYFF